MTERSLDRQFAFRYERRRLRSGNYLWKPILAVSAFPSHFPIHWRSNRNTRFLTTFLQGVNDYVFSPRNPELLLQAVVVNSIRSSML
jgi:hypothetical protein